MDPSKNEKQAQTPMDRGDNASCGTSNKSGYAQHLHTRLWERKRCLERDLKELNEALELINDNPAVQRVLKVMSVAG
jgi:hypothetical protein